MQLTAVIRLSTIALCGLQLAADCSAEDRSHTNNAPSGRIFVNAFIREEGGGRAGLSHWVISVDPNTGRWNKIIEDVNFPRVTRSGQTVGVIKDKGIWTLDLRTSALRQTFDMDYQSPTVWSPDGKSFLLSDHSLAIKKTWRFDVDGANQTRVRIPDGYWVTDWAADGRLATNHADSRISVIRPDGSDEVTLPTRGNNARFSPDSKRLAYDRKWEGTINIIDVAGESERTVFDGGRFTVGQSPCWSPDGGFLVFLQFNVEVDAEGEPLPGRVNGHNSFRSQRLVVVNMNRCDVRQLRLAKQGAKEILVTHEFDWR